VEALFSSRFVEALLSSRFVEALLSSRFVEALFSSRFVEALLSSRFVEALLNETKQHNSVSYKTPTALLITQFDKSLVGDKETPFIL
jgi:hypothetical protein